MFLSWLRRRRRRALLASPFPEAWRPWLETLPSYNDLDDDERTRLHDILRAIMVNPSVHVVDDPDGWGGSSVPVSGQAWYRGPIVIAWDAAEHGALDPRDGDCDGTPDLDDPADRRTWVRLLTPEFEAPKVAARKGRRSVLDQCGATDEAEFFAVATETFFEKPRRMSGRHTRIRRATTLPGTGVSQPPGLPLGHHVAHWCRDVPVFRGDDRAESGLVTEHVLCGQVVAQGGLLHVERPSCPSRP